MNPRLESGTHRSLAAAMVLQYAVGGAAIAFITLWFRERGLTVAQTSTTLLAASAVLLVSPFFWGMLADRLLPWNRLFVVMNGLAVLALGALAVQQTFGGILLAFLLFYACYQPAPTLVNALAFRHLRHPIEEFPRVRAWGSVGWVLPSLPIFLWLALRPERDLALTLYWAMGFAVAMMVTAFWLPHTPPGAHPRRSTEGPHLTYGEAVRRLFHNPNYVVVFASYFLVSASFSIQAFYSPPRLVDLGMSRAWTGPVQSIGVVVEIGLFLWQGVLVKRWRYSTPVLLGCVVLVVRQLLFAFSDNLVLLSLSYVLVGTTVVFYHIGVSILVNAIAGPEVKATAQTLLVLCSSGLGPMFANGVVGWMSHGKTPDLRGVFLFSAVLAALASLLIAWRGRRLAPHPGSP